MPLKWFERAVEHGGKNAEKPAAPVGGPWCRERSARQLLRVEAIRALLGAVLDGRQCVGVVGMGALVLQASQIGQLKQWGEN